MWKHAFLMYVVHLKTQTNMWVAGCRLVATVSKAGLQSCILGNCLSSISVMLVFVQLSRPVPAFRLIDRPLNTRLRSGAIILCTCAYKHSRGGNGRKLFVWDTDCVCQWAIEGKRQWESDEVKQIRVKWRRKTLRIRWNLAAFHPHSLDHLIYYDYKSLQAHTHTQTLINTPTNG